MVETEVLIVGGGPVGLTARALLARWGVRTQLIEKHRDLSPFPRSRLVNVRSMEIFRRLGIAGTIAAKAFGSEYGRVRFRDTLSGKDYVTAAMIGVNAPIPDSPTLGVLTSQDRLEPTLLAAADTPVRFDAELAGLDEETDGVVATLADGTQIRARYVLGADGANSTVRKLLGVGTTGPGSLGDFMTVVFDADLGWCADEPAGVYFTPRGSLAPVYPEGEWAWFNAVVSDADPQALVRQGLGVDVDIDVLRVQHWTMTAFVADRYREGRILLAGDAAHTVPAIGGLGMNAGLADVDNLCWKLAGVLRGWAGPSLLETYEQERHPVAEETLRQAVGNARLLFEAGQRLLEQGPSAPMELPWSDQYFAQLGLILGVAYDSPAIVADDSAAPPPGTDYIPTTKPGHRLPHRWLKDEYSTLDTLGEWFTLLTPDPVVASELVHVEVVSDQDATLLVRPDGHIGARWVKTPSEAEVREAVAAITAG